MNIQGDTCVEQYFEYDRNTTIRNVIIIGNISFGYPRKQSQHGSNHSQYNKNKSIIIKDVFSVKRKKNEKNRYNEGNSDELSDEQRRLVSAHFCFIFEDFS